MTTMTRCESAGKFRVEFSEMGLVDGVRASVGHMKYVMHQHAFDAETRDGSPILDTDDPYEGDLCAHELDFLHGFPGKHYNYKWEFVVTPLGGRKKRK